MNKVINRSAKTGKFVSEKVAKRKPATTVTEKPSVTYGQIARVVRTWVGQQANHDTRVIANKVLKLIKKLYTPTARYVVKGRKI